jgi:hypothetical protein
MIRLGALAALLALTACITGRPRAPAPLPGDADFKRAFLANYPELTPEQRAQMLEEPGQWRALLTSWNLLAHFCAQPTPRQRMEFVGTTDNHTFRDLRIVIADTAPEPALKAVLVYRDGRETDVTRDVKWNVEPKLGHVETSEGGVPRLATACMASDLQVSADFYGQRTGTLWIPVHKELTQLEIRGMESTENGVRLIAWCADGESSDVSCQADWTIQSEAYEIHGCGELRRKSPFDPNAKDTEPTNAVIRAAYGELQTAKTLRLR